MKALLICVGSRGDAEPFVALADRLLEDGHCVEFFLQPELKDLAPTQNNKLVIHDLPFTQYDFYKYAANPSKGSDHKNPRVRFIGAVTDIVGELVLPCWNSVINVAKDCDVMVTSALSRSLCFALTAKLDIPTILVHLQPLVPTRLFPHSSNTDDFVQTLLHFEESKSEYTGCDSNLESYWSLEEYQHEFLEQPLDKLYDEMGLEPYIDIELTKSILSGYEPRIFLANALVDNLIPRISDGGPNVHHVGALADHYISRDFEPPKDLMKFLLEHQRPVCVGFGSMPYQQVELILDALEEVGRPAILVGKALELPPVAENEGVKSNKKNVIQFSNVPYAWLLPQCQMMLCHGGAGVVAATLRAGIPIVISPFMGDQFFFAELCKARGLGARAGSTLAKATKEDFVRGIQDATACIGSAQTFGEQIRGNSSLGVDNLIKLLRTVVKTKEKE